MKRRLQVFVSSTYSDLLPERQAAVSAILKAGHIPAGMELFTAGDKSQWETIKQWIDESDVYMLILGGRYGSVEATSGTSYTELEYDYAIQQKKPLFAVVVTEVALEQKVKSGGTAFIEMTNSKSLEAFRKKVLSNISSFFDDPKDIKLCVHETLADFAASRSLKGWVQADEVVDTKPLFEEIKKLSDENHALKEVVRQLEQRAVSKEAKQKQSLIELEQILKGIEITVPAKISGDGKDWKTDLLNLFWSNRDTLVNGVTNKMGAGDVDLFFFYHLCPKLQVHQLTKIEKIAGAQYRRAIVTPFGHEFLADMQKRMILSKTKEESATASASTADGTTASPAPKTKAKRKKPTK